MRAGGRLRRPAERVLPAYIFVQDDAPLAQPLGHCAPDGLGMLGLIVTGFGMQ